MNVKFKQMGMTMKKFVVVILLLMVPFAITAQDKRDGARMTFDKTTHDFGEVMQGDTVSYTFRFRNNGNQPLVISNVLTTCGCTAPDWTKEPIPPNQTGQIVVKFDSKGRSGRQNKVVTVISNAVSPQTRINIRANILPRS
jgi:hypothetical protein